MAFLTGWMSSCFLFPNFLNRRIACDIINGEIHPQEDSSWTEIRSRTLTLMLMYLTSWEESLVPGLRKKPDRDGIYPKIRRCWKGYDFGILNELTDEGLVNAGGRSKSASFNAEGEAKIRELLKAYGIEIDTSE